MIKSFVLFSAVFLCLSSAALAQGYPGLISDDDGRNAPIRAQVPSGPVDFFSSVVAPDPNTAGAAARGASEQRREDDRQARFRENRRKTIESRVRSELKAKGMTDPDAAVVEEMVTQRLQEMDQRKQEEAAKKQAYLDSQPQ